MREFNLEEALEGKPICTRDGHRARLIITDWGDDQNTIVALVDHGLDVRELRIDEDKNLDTHYYNQDGRISWAWTDDLDLMMKD